MKTRNRELQVEGLTLDEASIVSGSVRTKLYEAIADSQLTARKFISRTIILKVTSCDFWLCRRSMSGLDLRHLNQVQLSRRWNISPRTLERWRWLKAGPAYLKIGGRVVYRLEDVENYETTQLHLIRPSAPWRR